MASTEREGPDLDDGEVWEQLLDQLDLGALLVAIESRLARGTVAEMSADDILQETLMAAWKDRAKLDWRGLRAFRAWLLTIAENRIRDAARARRALRREDRAAQVTFADVEGWVGRSTTPSRMARYRERAEAMLAALASLPEGERDVVRLRLFEGESTTAVAERLGLGVSAVKHRLRSGSRSYRQMLRRALSTGVDGETGGGSQPASR